HRGARDLRYAELLQFPQDAAVFCQTVLYHPMLTSDTDAWHALDGAVPATVITLMAAYGCYTATGGGGETRSGTTRSDAAGYGPGARGLPAAGGCGQHPPLGQPRPLLRRRRRSNIQSTIPRRWLPRTSWPGLFWKRSNRIRLCRDPLLAGLP